MADFMTIGSEFHAIVAAILKRFSPLMVLLIRGIASRLCSEDEHVVRAAIQRYLVSYL